MLRAHKAKARPNINKLERRKIIKLGISRKIELFKFWVFFYGKVLYYLRYSNCFHCFASSSAHNIETSKVAAIFADAT